MNSIISLEEDLSDLKDFLPLNMRNTYFNTMFENLILIEKSEFYNNAVINLTHFYNYILHCFLVQIYYAEENIKLLKYLQKTTEALNSRDNSNKINLDENFDVSSFVNIEKDSINYFFHILGLDKGSDFCKNNKKIFDLRNYVAHLNMDIINKNRFEEFVEKIKYNLNELLKQNCNYTEEIVVKELKLAIEEDRIDKEFSYAGIFEGINSIYCISLNFYKLFLKNNKFENVQENSPLFYMKKYIEEILCLEREN